MDSVGEFHKGEIHGKPYLLYQNVIKPQIHIPNSSEKNPLPIEYERDFMEQAVIDSGDNLPLFICPSLRFKLTVRIETEIWDEDEDEDVGPRPDDIMKLKISHLLGHDDLMYLYENHDIFPLFWCNNKEADYQGKDCEICGSQKVGTDYYYCVKCDQRYHKECVESPLEINYPSHPKHSLQLHYSMKTSTHCILCTKKADRIIYYCALCDIYMHPLCAQAAIPFFIDQPKRHDHTLSLFPRQASLTCNVCGLVDKLHLTYVCRSICDFVVHTDCIHIPQTIRISRHFHRVSFTSSLPSGKWCCGVCRREIDSDYGAYTCNVCSGYAVHTRCALRKDIWDGIELEGVPEDEDVEPPFQRIADGIILHFSHGCHMKFETNGVYKENKFCQACVLPTNEENFYVCVEECDFILHETCANAPRKKVHPLHPHPIEQKVVHENHLFGCGACMRKSSGFGYVCTIQDCDYMLDVVCASVSEPFDYQGHQHPLFLALDPKETTVCHICKFTGVQKVLNCIECDFVICFKCATLPYMVRYKHDEHYLTFCHGDEASGSDDWCELCEGKLAIGGKEGFYKCNDCSTTLHIYCLVGPDPYMKPYQTFRMDGGGDQVHFHRNSSATRPICRKCKIRCPYPIYLEIINHMITSFLCAFKHPKTVT